MRSLIYKQVKQQAAKKTRGQISLKEVLLLATNPQTKNCKRHCNFIDTSVQITQSLSNFSITFYFTSKPGFVIFVHALTGCFINSSMPQNKKS